MTAIRLAADRIIDQDPVYLVETKMQYDVGSGHPKMVTGGMVDKRVAGPVQSATRKRIHR